MSLTIPIEVPVPKRIIENLDDFDRLLAIAKKHGVLHMRVDGIEVSLPPTAGETRQADAFVESPKVDTNAEAYLTYKNL